MQKRNDYVRYKALRKINRRHKADQEKQSKIAEKELKKRLRFTPRKFYLGKDPENNQQDYSWISPESRILLLAYNQDMKNLEDLGQAIFDIGRFGYKNVASPIIRYVKNKKK